MVEQHVNEIIAREEKFASRMGSKYEWQGGTLNFGK